MSKPETIVSISGGKDSTAIALLAHERAEKRGANFRLVFADTGHENPVTVEYVHKLGAHLGRPIEIIKPDFTEWFTRRRKYVREVWPIKIDPKTGETTPQHVIDKVLAALHSTGIPFLDLAMLKGRFPSTKARFCTEHLKTDPIFEQVIYPTLMRAPIISWTGERWDESLARSTLSRFHKWRPAGASRDIMRHRPILHWSVANVYAMHDRHNFPRNPLYDSGMSRVGCFPCINVKKDELRAIADRFPEAMSRLEDWEKIVGDCAKRGMASFFPSGLTPQTKRDRRPPTIRDAVEWSRTSRGGVQLDLIGQSDFSECSSTMGLCE